jgi:hypothetical protein
MITQIGYFTFKQKMNKDSKVYKQIFESYVSSFFIMMQEGSKYEYLANKWIEIV